MMRRMQNQSADVKQVSDTRVACAGDVGSEHPRVFLHLDRETGEAVCPYCSRVFKNEDGRGVSRGLASNASAAPAAPGAGGAERNLKGKNHVGH